jgi:glycosyltransferase involved in cell wall biosynthesis
VKNALSVIVIARNEEESLPDCLASVKTIADEIILVDSGSNDKTLEIAKQHGAKTFFHEWNGYSAQKQFALEQAQGPWILNLDADERVSPGLANEIKRLLGSTEAQAHQGYRIFFHHYFGPQRLRFGGVQNESHLRLFRKDQARYGAEKIHEGIQVQPPIGTLYGHIDHFSYKDIHDYLTKCNHYTTMIAREKFQKGARFHLWHHLRLPFEFFVRYFLCFGFLDGKMGLQYAILSSYYVWLKYAKLKDFKEASV